MEQYPSKLLESAVNELSKLPGIGRKSALRMALHLLKKHPEEVEALAGSISKMAKEIKFCSECHCISDEEICHICSNPKRVRDILCVVEDIRDVIAIEKTGQFIGLYHVLGGIISPMEGIAPADLTIESLVTRCGTSQIREIILALPATIEGDTTNYYISKKLDGKGIALTIIARGISFGDDLEYTDEVTLGRSILNRQPYAHSLHP